MEGRADGLDSREGLRRQGEGSGGEGGAAEGSKVRASGWGNGGEDAA